MSAAWILWVALTGCGGDSQGPDPEPNPEPDPLAVTSVTPADGATDVPPGALLTATFNRAVDPVTLTPESFVLRAGGTPLASTVTYDPVARTARLAGPLLPASLYQVELTTAIADDEGGVLSAAEEWSFTTRTWQEATVAADGNVGWHSSLAVDGTGRRHVVYFDATDFDLEYATCAGACTDGANWTGVTVEDADDIGRFASLAIDDADGLHVTYYDGFGGDLKYATCAATCTEPANWASVLVDETGIVGFYGSLIVGMGGRLHAAYHDISNDEVKYATCGGECTTAANWTAAAVNPVVAASFTVSIAEDATGRLHITHARTTSSGLDYVTCSAACTTGANWTPVTVDGTGGLHASLAVASDGAVHVAYKNDFDDNLVYVTCAGQCTTSNDWNGVIVDEEGNVGSYTSLERDAAGRLHLSYYDETNGDLKYAICAAECTSQTSWQSAAVDQDGNVGLYTSLALDDAGRVQVSYYRQGEGDLKYIE
jgi:hypothetical protein